MNRHRIEAMAEEQRYRYRCHTPRIADNPLLYGFILAKEPSMRRFDAKEPPKPRGTPSSSRSATPSWPPYLRGHPAQRLIPDEEILRLYVEEKLDGGTIGYRAGCSGSTVFEIVRSLGGVVRGRGEYDSGKPLKLTDVEIIQRYRNGVSGTVLAEQAGCGRNRMFSLLHSYGVKLRNATERGATDRMIARTQARLDGEKG